MSFFFQVFLRSLVALLDFTIFLPLSELVLSHLLFFMLQIIIEPFQSNAQVSTSSFALQKFCSNLIESPEPVQATPEAKRRPGRPRKLFSDKKPDSQYREGSEILSALSKYSFEAIIRALALHCRREKKIHAAAIFHELEDDTDFRALRLRQAKKFFEEYPRKK